MRWQCALVTYIEYLKYNPIIINKSSVEKTLSLAAKCVCHCFIVLCLRVHSCSDDVVQPSVALCTKCYTQSVVVCTD